jgi:hypothetical protein
MARSDHEFLLLKNVLKIIRQNETPEEILSELYVFLYGPHQPPRILKAFGLPQWETALIARAIPLVGEIIAHYIRLFHDPRNLPVTYYWKQKQVSHYLEDNFCAILWEATRRSNLDQPGYNVYEETETDDFLDKPIQFFKGEAKAKRIPGIGKSAGVLPTQQRFMEKVNTSGIHLERLNQHDFHSL